MFGQVEIKKPPAVQVVDNIYNQVERDISRISNVDAIRKLREACIAKRLNTTSVIENLRLRCAENLIRQVEDGRTNPTTVLHILKVASEAGAVDLGLASDSPTTKGGINLTNVIHNKSSSLAAAQAGASAPSISGGDSEGKATSSTVQDIGSLIEAIISITEGLKKDPKIIDILPDSTG